MENCVKEKEGKKRIYLKKLISETPNKLDIINYLNHSLNLDYTMHYFKVATLFVSLLWLSSCDFNKKPSVKAAVISTPTDPYKMEHFTIENSSGITIEILNLGGIIQSIRTPDKNGAIKDIVLGFTDAEKYSGEHPYFGAIVGRFSNRIAEGKFNLEGKTYTLATNNGPNHLHGGIKGFDKVFWSASPFSNKNSSGVTLSYMSKDMEEGYPGNLAVVVTYTLTEDNILKIHYQAQTDKTTVLNLTQHSYFNLSGDFSKQILDHELQLNADQFLQTDANQIPNGTYQDVVNSPFDFRTPKTIGQDIAAENEHLKIGKGYDHCWVINKQEAAMVKTATVHHPESGRIMEVFTDQPGVQLYTGNFLDNSLPSKTGGTYGPRSGFCLETQHFPDAPNQSSFPSTVLNPGETFTSETWFKFSVNKN